MIEHGAQSALPLRQVSEEERQKLARDVAKLDDEIAKVEAKLNDPAFLSRAPEAVREKTRRQLDELRERRDRVPRTPLDLRRSRPMAEDEGVRGGSVDQPERHSRVQRVHKRALAFDEEQLPAPLDALDDEPLGCAREEVGDDGVHRFQKA